MAKWTESRPDDDFYQVLAPDGTLEDDVPDLDEKILSLQRRGETSIPSRSVGEEAIPIGSVAA